MASPVKSAPRGEIVGAVVGTTVGAMEDAIGCDAGVADGCPDGSAICGVDQPFLCTRYGYMGMGSTAPHNVTSSD